MTRARVSIADENPGSAERDLHQALRSAAEVQAHLVVPDLLECLARVVGGDGNHRDAARFAGAADAMREAHGAGMEERAQEHLAQTRALIVMQLGESRFAAEEQIGRTLTEEQAIALALESTAGGA